VRHLNVDGKSHEEPAPLRAQHRAPRRHKHHWPAGVELSSVLKEAGDGVEAVNVRRLRWLLALLDRTRGAWQIENLQREERHLRETGYCRPRGHLSGIQTDRQRSAGLP